MMKKACKFNKEKSGLPVNHEIKHEEIINAMLQGENMLKNQNVELPRHINTLEADRIKLMKQLSHNASQRVENGIIFM